MDQPASRTRSTLRRSWRLGLLLGVVTAALALAASATASPGNGAVRIPVGNVGGEIDSSACGFAIQIGVVSDNEYIIHITTLADGTTIYRITGTLVESFTNENTGKTVVANVSGPGTEIFYPDGSVGLDAQGQGFDFFTPAEQAQFGEPGLVFLSGHQVALFAPDFSYESFQFSGSQINGCPLLS
jgi:hypothetical protein